ncbi:hypothetical protein [Hathewaya massiliensis]|uniref:hypothetical protein n=1 Tax=Hathewaya massiliensis TaxID=1964382 RepID=UPI00163C4202|nr:hypothetical protein [Hathewaya massiliensis]
MLKYLFAMKLPMMDSRTQKYLSSLMAKALVCFIYKKLKQNTKLEDILSKLKIA